MFFPKKIKVGFRKRNDTYSGQLAFVTYFDEKDILRQEMSWNGWRDKTIDPQEFDNKPIEGFVLNKKVGENRYSWNPRKAWVRIFDPRGFEFEISVENLLYILENVDCTRGKGLEGEFVYAWQGGKLILIPVDSVDYKKVPDQFKKISAKELKVGRRYFKSDGSSFIYLGRLMRNVHFRRNYDPENLRSRKMHAFFNEEEEGFYFCDSIPFVSNEEVELDITEYYNIYLQSDQAATVDSIKEYPTTRSDYAFIKYENAYYYYYCNWTYTNGYKLEVNNGIYEVDYAHERRFQNTENLQKMYLSLILSNGKEIKL